MDSLSHKNSYELLSMSTMSDTDSYSPEHMPEVTILTKSSPVRRKRLRKKLSTRCSSRSDDTQNSPITHGSKIFSIAFIILVLCCWLIVLSVLVAIFNKELRRFDATIMNTVTGTTGIADGLQECQLLTKELQRNQSNLYSHLDELNLELNNLNETISALSSLLIVLQQKVELSNPNPRSDSKSELDPSTVQSIDSQIHDFNLTLAQVINSSLKLDDNYNKLQINVTNLQDKIALLEKMPSESADTKEGGNITTAEDFQKLVPFIQNLTMNVALFNETLANKILEIKTEQQRDQIIIEEFQKRYENMTLNLSNLREEFDKENAQIDILMSTLQNLTVSIPLPEQMNITSSVKLPKQNKTSNTVKS